ncbi:hypothetical protein [Lacihabitans lacunae]|uniref:Uncharacterized protein n=1 Tax=Lacihabitans lacunae TaxID=1028214 RepID=A0ABV7Z2A2_9BACT
MIKTYFLRSYITFLVHNIIGLIFCLASYFIFLKINPKNEISGILNISLLFTAVLFFSIVLTKSFLIFIPSTFIKVTNKGLEFIKHNQTKNQFSWDSINKIELSIETSKLLNMYIFIKNEKTLRFVLKDKWLFSLFTMKCVKLNFTIIENLIEKSVDFENKFNSQNLNSVRENLNLTRTTYPSD